MRFQLPVGLLRIGEPETGACETEELAAEITGNHFRFETQLEFHFVRVQVERRRDAAAGRGTGRSLVDVVRPAVEQNVDRAVRLHLVDADALLAWTELPQVG